MRSKKIETVSEPIKKPPVTLTQSNAIFALDIGTRSVVGIVGVHDGNIFHVLDYEQAFHQERAMRDGQIENITLVASVVTKVKSALEKRNKLKLTKVCIAAAGRALITKKVTYTQELNPTEEITEKLLNAMEYSALGIAQSEFDQDLEEHTENKTTFYCVGYSITKYQLDNYQSSTIIGHKGKEVTIDLIAAFLPQNVVQNLYAVMAANQLTVENLTLEPIAAINVVVPEDIRLLNIALVDIGAGTSDIAISKDGSIIAYDMVTTAGDEITEAIMQKCLCNFENAEKIKIALDTDNSQITYTDILGNIHKEVKSKLLKNLKSAIKVLSEEIANGILKANGAAPTAVFLAGGGCQIPGFCQAIATELKIPFENVAISGNQSFKNVAVYDKKLQNPEFITPLGIGAMSSIYKGCDFFSITINGKKQMLLNYRESKVADALLLSSIKPQNLIGFPARSINYYIDGKRYNKKGENAVPGELYVNGELASIDTKIKQGDVIVAKEAIPGKQPVISIKDLKQEEKFRFSVIVDEVLAEVPVIFYKDGEQLQDDYIIKPMDRLTTEAVITLTDLLDNMETSFQPEEMVMLINNSVASPDALIAAGDQISFISKQQSEKLLIEEENKQTKQNLEEVDDNIQQQSVILQQTQEIHQTEVPQIEQYTIPNKTVSISEKEDFTIAEQTEILPEISKEEMSQQIPPMSEDADHIIVSINGVWKTIPLEDRKKLLFYDMLNYVDIDLEKPQGNIIIKLNGEDTSYTASISQGDSIEVAWDKHN
ncbi:cell division FtsA domain-containing protein [Clostridium sp. MD294]|uniref:cell division protein FtsA n=1 Tax=Clostridium sp. MD294 TaxID=97138 RepID=UPI0002CB8358|nr:cell division FtsA domain-containing protein [Clostridium sp. MD294]USF29139.1 Cell division protein FtsA [Clostridium sp. MD294]